MFRYTLTRYGPNGDDRAVKRQERGARRVCNRSSVGARALIGLKLF